MRAIETLRSDWESLARRDALHAILTDETKRGGQWDLAEFMETGVAEVRTVVQYLGEIGCALKWKGTALDFGCGVGRLTQALGSYFHSCIGIDISESMIANAQSFNQRTNCRYLVNSSVQLPFLASTFSFVYSNIVLQHIPRRIAERYLREFLRVLEPGGVMVFGVQDSFAAPTFSARGERIRHIIRLRSRIKSLLRVGPGDMQMHCLPENAVRRALGSAQILDIRFNNTAAKDFNGKLTYLAEAPHSGYIGKQYCVLKPPTDRAN